MIFSGLKIIPLSSEKENPDYNLIYSVVSSASKDVPSRVIYIFLKWNILRGCRRLEGERERMRQRKREN